jgi:pimeloyl-ACP methyl ester carboxylesterase
VAEFSIKSSGVTLAGEEAGEGTPVVLLHGLTATRRYVVMGSRALERSGHRVVTYDARGHGASSGAEDPDAYDYDDLVEDLRAVMDDRGIDRAVLVGASMGAHTAVRMALDHPERVAGLVIATPAFDPEEDRDEGLERWDALSEGLRNGGVDGFVEAYGDPQVPAQWKETIDKVLRQRLGAHEHPDAVADALHAVPRSRPFESWDELGEIAVPTVVVASRDDADPGHPYAIGERYAEAIPGAELRSEEPGSSPLAWQGGQLSKVISELAERAGAAGP